MRKPSFALDISSPVCKAIHQKCLLICQFLSGFAWCVLAIRLHLTSHYSNRHRLKNRNDSMEPNRLRLVEVSAKSEPSSKTGSIKGRSHSLTTFLPMPSVCITPSVEEETVAGGSGSEPSWNDPETSISNATKRIVEKKSSAKHRPRLSIPHIFTNQSSLSTSPLSSTPSISSLLSAAAAARNFSFSIPHSMRRGSWSVSLLYDRT